MSPVRTLNRISIGCNNGNINNGLFKIRKYKIGVLTG